MTTQQVCPIVISGLTRTATLVKAQVVPALISRQQPASPADAAGLGQPAPAAVMARRTKRASPRRRAGA